MTHEITLARAFGDSPIDEKRVRSFLRDLPSYLHWAYDEQLQEAEKDILNRLDFFEFHYRRYLLSCPKTLHRVLSEVRSLTAHHPQDATYYINHVLAEVRKTLLAEEWYELVPRLDKSAEKIRTLLPDLDPKLTPLTLFVLKESYPGHAEMRELRITS